MKQKIIEALKDGMIFLLERRAAEYEQNNSADEDLRSLEEKGTFPFPTAVAEEWDIDTSFAVDRALEKAFRLGHEEGYMDLLYDVLDLVRNCEYLEECADDIEEG